MSDLNTLESGNPHVAVVEINRPPYNFISIELLAQVADELEAIDQDPRYRCTVLTSNGKAFCAGAELSSDDSERPADSFGLYDHAVRIFKCKKPLIAAVQGAAVGAGLGLAVAADFRVASPEARFSANFCRLGFHPGFGLSYTLPRLIGQQHASNMFFTGRRVAGEEALRLGLIDDLVAQPNLTQCAIALATEIAASAPQAVMATRATLRAGIAEQVIKALENEKKHQKVHMAMEDFSEGIRAMNERRLPVFNNR